MVKIKKTEVLNILNNVFGCTITDASFDIRDNIAGTVGEIYHISGQAYVGLGFDNNKPFDLILKVQKKWDRYQDSKSWKREYNLYATGFFNILPASISHAKCYGLKDKITETWIWMEYIKGVSGKELDTKQLSDVLYQLGHFQGKFVVGEYKKWLNLPWLSDQFALQKSFKFWYGEVYVYLQNNREKIPNEICEKLLIMADSADQVWSSISNIPITLCHRDITPENVFININQDQKEKVYIIDWDCAGYGIVGEDAINLIGEWFVFYEKDTALLPKCINQFMDSYYLGIKQSIQKIVIPPQLIRDILLLCWGYRIIYRFVNIDQNELKQRYLDLLKAIIRL